MTCDRLLKLDPVTKEAILCDKPAQWCYPSQPQLFYCDEHKPPGCRQVAAV